MVRKRGLSFMNLYLENIYNPNKRKEYKLVERIKGINLLCSGNNRVFCLGLLIDDKGDTNKEKDFKIKKLVLILYTYM